MLTKSDLSNIRTAVKEEIQIQTSQIVRSIVKDELKPVTRAINKLRKDLEFSVGALDKGRWKLENRFNAHINHPPTSQI